MRKPSIMKLKIVTGNEGDNILITVDLTWCNDLLKKRAFKKIKSIFIEKNHQDAPENYQIIC